MGRKIASRSCRAHGYNNFGPLVTIDIGEHDLFDRSIASTNKARGEEGGFVLGRCGIIKPHAEAANRASLKIPFCNYSCLS